MDMWSANRCRCSRGSRLPGSARVSRAGERVLAIANFSQLSGDYRNAALRKLFRRDAETSTRDACATQARVFARLLRAFFERSGFAAQVRENFAGKMK